MSDALNRGLEDAVVAETRLSSIDGERGELRIAGYDVADLAPNATYEEVLFLLLNDRLPDADELAALREDLAGRRDLPDETHGVLRAAAEEGEPAMAALRMAAAAGSLGHEGEDPDLDARRMVAALPTAVAAYWRYRQGEDAVAPREDLRHAANYLYMLTGEEPDPADVRGLETYLNAVVDHGFNASTFTARTVVSTESDVVSAVTAAIGALKGPLHGGAPGPVLDMLDEIRDAGDPAATIREKLEAGERLMGFGHRVYDVRDPRAAVLSGAAEGVYDADDPFLDLATEVEDIAVDLLAEYKPGRNLETNVEFYTAVLLRGVGIPRELFSTTFAVGRVAGWGAHCLEQLDDNRLVRPRARYVGATDREWTPLDDR